jgi:hypothetical protein
MMLDDVLAARIDNPVSSSTATSSEGGAQESHEAKVIGLVTKLVELNGLDQ